MGTAITLSILLAPVTHSCPPTTTTPSSRFLRPSPDFTTLIAPAFILSLPLRVPHVFGMILRMSDATRKTDRDALLGGRELGFEGSTHSDEHISVSRARPHYLL
ncbi:hypothetical protein R3P38DRAFT_590289 [Favolaschia claudopus]|uniref:Uncharacterized protein n=1 Tax=Favolaschia claudopus TaxID=2862362 RepID=A0AAW0CE15_9AGAR